MGHTGMPHKSGSRRDFSYKSHDTVHTHVWNYMADRADDGLDEFFDGCGRSAGGAP